MSGHANPYREGCQYHATFGYMQKKQVFTRAEVLAFTAEKFGKEKPADVTVLFSPRKESKRGDCRGNISAQGHLYFVGKLARQVKGGVKGPQKFRLFWRAEALEPRTRATSEVKAVKSPKTTVKAAVKDEAKTEVKADAETTPANA